MPPLILVAEDETDLRMVLGDLITDEGYRVHLAVDGSEALDLFTTEVPALIVSNISMPRVDGITLVHRLREGGHAVPVVLLSAEDVTVDLPGVVLIAKPFDLDQVMEAIEAGLGASNPDG